LLVIVLGGLGLFIYLMIVLGEEFGEDEEDPSQLRCGRECSIVSDAGMPLISISVPEEHF
jgi:hypothetical protein